MPEQNVTTRFKVDISDLKKGIADANKSIKLANAEFKNATAGLDDWSSSADGLTAKIRQQNAVVDAEKKKLDLLKEQLDRLNKSQQDGEKIIADLTAKYDDAVKTYGATSDEAKKYAKQLADAQAAQERNTKAADDLNIKIINQDTAVKNAVAQVDKYETALAELGNESDDTAKQTENLTDKVERQQKELDDLKNKYKNVAAEQGTTSDEAKDLAAKISDLSGELKENRDKLDAAADAADDLDQSIEDAGKSAETAANGGFTVFKGVLSSLLTDVLGKIITSITDLTSEAISASDTMAKFEQTMGFAGYDDATIKAASENVKDYADRTVYELDTIANTTAQLAANGIEDFNGLTQAAGNLNAVAGGNADTFNSVAMVLTQTAGAGKLTTENWNQLANAIPGASGVLMDALKDAGAYTGDFRDAMAKGQITADEFNAAIMKLGNEPVAVEAATSVSTFEGAVGNLQATVVSALMDIYDTIGRENIAKAITKVSDLVSAIIPPIVNGISWLLDHIPEVTGVIVGLGTAVAAYIAYTTALNVMTNGWKALTIVIKAQTAAQWLLNTAMNANPIGLIIAAIAGLVAAFVVLWNKSEKFRNFWIALWDKIKKVASGAWDAIKKFFSGAWDAIKKVWNGATAFFTGIWNGIKNVFSSVVSFFTGIWDGVKAVFSTVAAWINENVFQPIINLFKPVIEFYRTAFEIIFQLAEGCWSLIKAVWSVVSTWFNDHIIKPVTKFFKDLWDGIKNTASAAWNGIKTIWNVVSTWFNTHIITPVKNFFTGMWDAIKTAASNTWNGIKGVWNAVSGWFNSTVIEPVKNFFGGMWDKVKSGASDAWNGITSVFGGVADWFKDKFSKAWEAVKDVFSTGGKVFDGIKEGITDAFKTVVNAIIRGINKVISIPFNAINNTLDKIRDVSIAGIKPFSGLISRFDVPEIPELEQGGILKRGQVGLLEGNGEEAVVPLERNTGGLKKIAAILAADLKKSGGLFGGSKGGKTVVNNYNFNQTNNSPKALSRFEIYRQTKNIINAAKGV